ncbi:hypothetical protein ACSF59_11255 [Escherichia coli]|uniref:hypothetical protein n=1 Tax=Escherichia coli TaxID=562 RepID=UPI003EF010BC
MEEESVAGRIIKRAEGPALAGMLRSECYRLGLSALAEQLSLLFRQYPQPGIRESLMLLCWCELVKGIEPEAWVRTASAASGHAEEMDQYTTKRVQWFIGTD